MPRELGLTFAESLVRKVIKCIKTQTRRPEGRSPKASAGDVLYVRETWAPVDRFFDGCVEREDPVDVGYRASRAAWSHIDRAPFELDVRNMGWDLVKWRPSIHMPRWAARLFLPLVEVRTERVNDITDEDAIAEGIEFDGSHWRGLPGPGNGYDRPKHAFLSLWDSIYADPKEKDGGPNDTRQNPLVRVYRWTDVVNAKQYVKRCAR